MAMKDGLKYAIWFIVLILFLLVLIGVGFKVNEFGIDKAGGKILQFAFLGTDDLNSLNIDSGEDKLINEVALLITALMIWIIIFFAFGDIIENFSAFSPGIGWVIAFAVAVIGANVKLMSKFLVWSVAIFAWAGAAAVFLALLGSFFAFFVVNWGITPLMGWIRGRKVMMRAATGRRYADEGLRTLIRTGRTAAE